MSAPPTARALADAWTHAPGTPVTYLTCEGHVRTARTCGVPWVSEGGMALIALAGGPRGGVDLRRVYLDPACDSTRHAAGREEAPPGPRAPLIVRAARRAREEVARAVAASLGPYEGAAYPRGIGPGLVEVAVMGELLDAAADLLRDLRGEASLPGSAESLWLSHARIAWEADAERRERLRGPPEPEWWGEGAAPARPVAVGDRVRSRWRPGGLAGTVVAEVGEQGSRRWVVSWDSEVHAEDELRRLEPEARPAARAGGEEEGDGDDGR